MIIAFTKKYIADMHDALHLLRKSAFQSIAFQLFFDLAYIFLFIIIAQTIFRIVVEYFDKLTFYLNIGNAIGHIPYFSFINIHAIFALSGLLLIFALFSMVEKNTLIILTSLYYRNTPVSSYRAFVRACIKTPHLLKMRIVRMRTHFYVLAGLYVTWQSFLQILPAVPFAHWINTIIIIYCTAIIIAIIFKYTMDAYVICVEKNESSYEFDEKAPRVVRKKRIYATVTFYAFLLLVVFLWIIVFSVIVKILIIFSYNHPDFIAYILTFFIAGTVMSIFVFLSLVKTLRISVMTVMYHEERLAQKKLTPISPSTQLPTKSPLTTIAQILVLIVIGSLIVSLSVYPKTARIISHAEEYVQESPTVTTPSIPTTEDELVNYIFSTDQTTIDAIEKVIFSYIATFLHKTRL